MTETQTAKNTCSTSSASSVFDLKLTEKAVAKIKEYQEKMPEAKGKTFRVYVQGGGCSGFSYGFIFDEKRDDDLSVSNGGVDCFRPAKCNVSRWLHRRFC